MDTHGLKHINTKRIHMNEFQYTIAFQEMKALTSKSSKAAFIKQHTQSRFQINNITCYSIKLLCDMYKEFPREVTGVKSLEYAINTYSGFISDIHNYKLLTDLPPVPVTVSAGNDFATFISSSGIPAQFKIAVLLTKQNLIL